MLTHHKLCQPGLHISSSRSPTEYYFVYNGFLPASTTRIWEWDYSSETPPYFLDFFADFGGVQCIVRPGDCVHLLGFRFKDVEELISILGSLPGFQHVERLSLEQLYFDTHPSMAGLTNAFRDPRLGRIKELTVQLFNGPAVEFSTPVLITLLAHCCHLKCVHFRGCGVSYSNSGGLTTCEMWKHWLSLSRDKPYAVVKERGIETISFEGVDCQRTEDVLAFMSAANSPFHIERLRCLSILCLTDYEKPSPGLCAFLEQILIRVRKCLEEIRLCFPLRNDLVALPRLRMLGFYVRKKTEHGTELLHWATKQLAKEPMAPSIEVGFVSPVLRWGWQDELRRHNAEDLNALDLAGLVKRRNNMNQDKYRQVLDLLSSFDGLDGVIASRVAQRMVTDLRIIGPSRGDSGLDWDEKLRGALFPRSGDKLQLGRVAPSVYH
ncbi:uncharacterized protein EV420DRAFT_513920 [Desarmillaria tabescens]|uniref:Uncharacterized protein n=1 Tax=Armillaria tabescens TaxID=1929756 RepID=A0AA39N4L6_ARMTA|nr:uncharacterized protein EV420DRAFT_513920 [Desarmillaria tabescens]KAK0457234.1 hypothetical protein EV420DRAFT_513920 [Desarmillaria tabescens]